MRRNLFLILPILAGLTAWYFIQNKDTSSIIDKATNSQLAYHKPLKKKRAKDDLKYDRPDLFEAFHRKLRTGAGENTPSYPANYQMVELGKAQSRGQAFRTENNNFKERGPGNVPGRTRALVVHPEDPKNTWYAGAAGGGIWKTTNGGQKWTHLTASLPTLSVASLAISASNPNVLYAGTGEGFFGGGSGQGFGIFKSEDGGQTWQQLQSSVSEEFKNVSRIVIDPADENILLASIGSVAQEGESLSGSSARSQIVRSTDGGVSWTVVYEVALPIYQIIADKSFNTFYAGLDEIGVIKSEDGGLTWKNSGNGLGQVNRVELAMSENNPNILYASTEGSVTGTSADLYHSNDAGANWKLLTAGQDEPNFDLLGGQGGYDNTILVNPYNDSIVYVGGVNTYKIALTNEPDTTIQSLLGTTLENETNFLQEEVRLFTDEGVEIELSEFVGVEIRFGTTLSQKAYRFSVPEGRTSGVSPEEYTYQNMIDVPFEVWDTKNNRQLAVSIRDQLNDGAFNLKNEFNDSREYIFVHALPYSETPDNSITKTGGHTYKNMYLVWIAQPTDIEWNANTIPENAKLNVNYGDIVTQPRQTTIITDQYGDMPRDSEFFLRNSGFVGGIHPDMHQLIALKSVNNEFQILASNDGGMYISDSSNDPGVQDSSWTMVGNTYNTSQFYGISKVPNQQQYLGGTQDNGSWLFIGDETDSIADANDGYLTIKGGDGFECQWHATKPSVLIATSQFNSIDKFDPATGWRTGTNGMTDVGDGLAPFISRLAYSKTDPDLIFAIGSSGVWRSDNFADSWQLAPITEKWFGSGDVDVSSANPQIVWAGDGMSEFSSIYVSKDGGISFNETKAFAEIGSTSGIYTHPTEEGTAFVLFSASKRPKILKTTDFGQTWEDITGFDEKSQSTGFPDVPVFSVLVMPHDTQRIWAGTEIGLFESNDEGKTWNLLTDFPNVSVWDMRAEDNEVVIATHGRGIWTATIDELANVSTPSVTLSPRLNELSQIADLNDLILNINMDLRSPYDSVQILKNDELLGSLGQNRINRPNYNYDFTVTEFDSIYVQAIGYKAGIRYESSTLSITKDAIIKFETPASLYETTFDDGKQNFVNFGFRIGEEDGFTGMALHSDHPYIDGSEAGGEDGNINYTATLTVPIIIAEKNASMTFNEVVLIETGEANSAFGDDGFYDYVIVEGSTDLKIWKPLVDGYDATSESDWTNAYNEFSWGDESMFKKRFIQLGNDFQAGETVFVRFRLFSDPVSIGFGWVIDDLRIQTEELISSTETSDIYQAVSVYPNPAPNGIFNLTINNVLDNNLTIKIYDSAGKVVLQEKAQRQGIFFNQQIRLTDQPKGFYIVEVSDGKQRVTKKLILK